MYRELNKNQKGFNLTELLIVVAIIAIIAAVALPSYNDSTRKTRRAEGKSFLMEVAQLQERHYTEFGRYAEAGTEDSTAVDEDTMLVTLTGTTFLSPNRHYLINHADLGRNTEGTSFTLTAIPQGGQATADAECDDLTLTNLGQRGVTGSANSDDCW